MPLVGLAAALVLLAWGGIELDHVIRAYPLQFWFGVASFLILCLAFAAAKFRRANEQVPLRPALQAVPPPPPAIKAAPVLTAIASAQDPDAAPCEGPGCARRVSEEPWTAQVDGEEEEHVFCSEACARKWDLARRRPAGRPF